MVSPQRNEGTDPTGRGEEPVLGPCWWVAVLQVARPQRPPSPAASPLPLKPKGLGGHRAHMPKLVQK